MRRATAVLTLGLLAGCGAAPAPVPPGVMEAEPDRDQVAAVVFLLGDPGEARPDRTPATEALRGDLARWDEAGVPSRVVYLGDLVYPVGVRPEGHPGHAQDTLALHAQLQVVLGLDHTEAVLVPGNHDWGDMIGPRGRTRLGGLHEVVRRWQAAGLPARVAPARGIGPRVEDFTPDHTLVYLDTHDWIQSDEEARAAAVRGLREAISQAPGEVLLLAHHPLRSGSSHGASPAGFGPRALLSRAGVVAQDLTSVPYARFRDEIDETIRDAGPVVLYAAGHDHNLQLFREPGAADWELVVGSGSKSNDLHAAPGMILGSSRAAYARLLLLEGGGVHMTLVTGGDHPLVCPAADAAACMAAATSAFTEVDARYLSRPSASGTARSRRSHEGTVHH